MYHPKKVTATIIILRTKQHNAKKTNKKSPSTTAVSRKGWIYKPEALERYKAQLKENIILNSLKAETEINKPENIIHIMTVACNQTFKKKRGVYHRTKR